MLTIAVVPVVFYYFSSDQQGREAPKSITREEKGDLDGALADFTKAIELDPKNPTAYNNRGNARKDKGDLDGALADYTKAISIDPAFPDVYFNRAIARRATNDPAGASQDLGKALELAPAQWPHRAEAEGMLKELKQKP